MKIIKIAITLVTFTSTILLTSFAFGGDNTYPWPQTGNVGIGTTNPVNGKLTIESPASSTVSTLRVVSGGSLPNNEIFIFGINGLTNGFRMRQDASSNVVYSFQGGNVGIGTTSPVNGKLTIESPASSTVSTLRVVSGGSLPNNEIFIFGINGLTNGFRMRQDASLNVVYSFQGGNVGVGTTTPDYKLDVKGTIRAEEVKVETGWSDFVFKDNYNLPTLDKVESYIKENKHLPDIPSAKQVEEEGLSMAEMMTKQMQKIEELTLYVIEQNKEIKELKKKVTQLEDRK